MSAGGSTALLAWVVLLAIAVFDDRTTRDSTGSIMMAGLVVSVLAVSLALSILAARRGTTVIITGLTLTVGAAAGGWAVYSAMPVAGPEAFITHRAGLAALAYGFGVLGGGLIALSEFVLPPYAAQQELPKSSRRRVSVLAAAVIILSATALAPAMQNWAELANMEASTVDDGLSIGDPNMDSAQILDVDGTFWPTPNGLLRFDHPEDHGPQAVTMIDPTYDPAEAEASGLFGSWGIGASEDPDETDAERWHHRRWNWTVDQEPAFSADRSLLALTGQRADNSASWQTRILDTATGDVAGTVSFSNGIPGQMEAVGESAVLYSTNRGNTLMKEAYAGGESWEIDAAPGCALEASGLNDAHVVAAFTCAPSPDRTEVEDHILGIDVDTGEVLWDWEAPEGSAIQQDNFLLAEDMLIVNNRVEQRVTDGPFSARGFENNLRGIDIATGEVEWEDTGQVFGRTHTSACGGTLHLDLSAHESELNGDRDPVFHLVECYVDEDRIGSRMGVRTFNVDDGDRQWRSSVRMGFTPLESDLARGWVSAMPDGRVLLVTDRSLDRNDPDCRIYGIEDGSSSRIEIDHDDSLPPDWCHDAQVGTINHGAAIDYVSEEGDNRVILVQ